MRSTFPGCPLQTTMELDADVVPFQPRVLLHELIFAHCPYLSRPCLTGNLLCRVDWLFLRGIAGCERAVLSIIEVATLPRCSSSRQGSSVERPPVCRTLPVPEAPNRTPMEPFRKRSTQCPVGHDADAVPFLPQFLLQELLFAHCPCQPRHHPRKFAEQGGLALSQTNRRRRVRHPAGWQT